VTTHDQQHSGAEGSSPRWNASLRATQRLLRTLALSAALVSGPLPAQTNTAKAASPNRCLLIVDTSRPMQRRTEATLKAVQDLVMSGLNGQFKRGDTFGVWTFNEALYAGKLPLQSWSPEGREETAKAIVAFLKAQKCEKAASFDKVLPALTHVVERSERLTVVLVSSGEENLHGTPFDKQISEFCQRLHDQQQKARMPFITVLSGRGGRLVDYTLNTPPWPLQLPDPPAEPQVAGVLQQRLQQALQTGQTTSAPPLIVSGKKPQPKTAPPPGTEATPAQAQPPAPTATSTGPDKPLGMVLPSEPPAQLAKLDPAPPAPGTPPAQLVPKPAPPPVPAAPPHTVKAPQANSVEAAPAQSNTAPPAPQPAAVAPATNALGKASGPSASAPLVSRPSSIAPPPAITATAVPGQSPAWRKVLWISVGAAVMIAGLVIVLRLRRSPPTSQGSLITRSYDRGRKP
jgi:hypothetical protein